MSRPGVGFSRFCLATFLATFRILSNFLVREQRLATLWKSSKIYGKYRDIPQSPSTREKPLERGCVSLLTVCKQNGGRQVGNRKSH